MDDPVFTAPWYPWYVNDALTSEAVDILSLAEEGAYRRALDKAWKKGSIPADPKDCARTIGKGCSTKIAQVVLRLFRPLPDDPERMINPRLEKVREEQLAKYHKRATAGQKGGNAKAMLQQTPSIGVANGKHSDTDKEEELKKKNKTAKTPVAEAAAIDPVERRIWTDGKELLIKSGMKATEAGSFLGKLAKDYTKKILAEAIAVTQAENPAEPKTFLVGVLKERSGKNMRQQSSIGKYDPSLPEPEIEVTCDICGKEYCLKDHREDV